MKDNNKKKKDININNIDEELNNNPLENMAKSSIDLSAEVTSLYNYEQKNSKKWLVVLIIVLSLIFVGLFMCKSFLLTPKNIFTYSLNKSYDMIESLMLKSNYNINENIIADFNVSWNIDAGESLEDSYGELLDEINKLSLNYTYGINYDEKALDLKIKLFDKNDTFDFNMFGRNNKLYLDLKDMYDKYIYVDLSKEEYESMFNNNYDIDKIQYILQSIKISFVQNIKDSDFNKTKETLIVNGQDLSTNKISFKLTEERYNRLSLDILKELKNDNTFVKYLTSLTNTDKDNVLKMINDEISRLESVNVVGDNVIIFNLYTSGIFYEIVKFEVIKQTDSSINTYSLSMNNDKYIFLINSNGTDELLLNINKNDNIYDFDGNIDSYKVNGKLITKGNTITVIYNLIDEINNNNYEGNLNINLSSEFTGEISSSVKTVINNEELATIVLNLDYNLEKNKKLENIDTQFSVLIDDMGDEDINGIVNNALSNNIINKFINLISNYVSDYNQI